MTFSEISMFFAALKQRSSGSGSAAVKRRDDRRKCHYIINYIIVYNWILVTELNFCWETKISRNLKGFLNWLTSGCWDWSSRLVYSLAISWLLERINVTRVGHRLIPDQWSWTSDETLQVKLVPTHINNVTSDEPVSLSQQLIALVMINHFPCLHRSVTNLQPKCQNH